MNLARRIRRARHLALVLLLACSGCAAVSGFGEFEKCEGADCVEPDSSFDTASPPPDTPLADGGETSDALADTTTDDTTVTDTIATDTKVADTAVTDTSVTDTTVTTTDTLAADTGASDTSKTDTAPPIDAGACGGTAGAAMVKVGTFCIDSTEVTNAHYAAFLAAKGSDTSGQPAVCSWNTSYVPAFAWPAAVTEGNYPVHSVDWCDAFAYCKWAGKRLCGAVTGGPTPYGSYANPAVSEWYYACSQNGTRIYPYGNVYDATACEGVDIKPNKRVAVASMAGCVGGYSGIYDMSGNVYEWEDSCDAAVGATDNCRLRGGGIYSPFDYLKCSVDRAFARNTYDDNRGIRCCGL